MPATGAAREPRRWVLATAVLAALMLASVQLRSQAIHTSYWIDEGIAVGIAQFPLWDIPGVLLMDGSPPLYYMLLHVWQDWFGTGEVATRSLSLVFATLTIPLAFVLALRISGGRAAWMAALLAAGHPFLTYYAQETRMYSLVTLLALLLAGTMVLVFVQRRRGALPWAILAATGLAYTHNWGLFLVAASFVAALIVVFNGPRKQRRPAVVDGVIMYGVTGLLFLPWLPTLLEQAASTGAPWSLRPGFGELVSAVVVPFGYESTGVLLALITVLAIARIFTRDRAGDAIVVRAAVLLLLMIAGTGLLGWIVSQVSPAWTLRYLAVSVGPALLLAGLVLSRVPTVAVAVLVFLAVAWAQPLVERISNKGNMAQAAALARQQGVAGPGTVVVSPHPEQIPVISHYLGPEQRYATSLGWQSDPRVFDWRDGMDRLQAARPHAVWEPMREQIRPGTHVILVVPILRSASWRADWTTLVRTRSLQWQKMFVQDPGLERLGELPRYGDRRLPRGVRLIVYRRVADAQSAG